MREKRLAVKKLMLSSTFRGFLLVSVLIVSVLYVGKTSSISTKGYDINDLQSRITVLENDTERLEFEIAQHRSMQSIQARLQGMNLVAADSIEYTTLSGSEVARR